MSTRRPHSLRRFVVLTSVTLGLSACSATSALPPSAEAADRAALGTEAPPAPSSSAQRAESIDVARVELEDAPGAPELEAGAAAIRAGDWSTARTELERVMPGLRGAARADIEAAGEALLGRACAKLGDVDGAAAHYAVVRAAYAHVPSTSTPDAAVRLSMAVAEAYFHEAEAERVSIDKRPMPTYRGDGDAASLHAFMESDVAPFVKTRLATIQALDQSYARILTLTPKPTRLRIAASSRIGQVWGRFTAELRAAPTPSAWNQKGSPMGLPVSYDDIRRAYYAALDEASAPQRKRATDAFQACARESAETGWKDDFSRQCDAWLEKN